MSEITTRGWFLQGYKDQIFTLWYSMGKPVIRILYPKVPAGDTGEKPTIGTVNDWIKSDEFKTRAAVLDEQVFSQINERMVAEKVEMLNRHADVGVEMQDMAMKYLQEHKDDLGVTSSVRLLVAGIEIERGSRGIGTTFEKVSNMSNTELEEEIKKLISRAPVEFTPTDEEIDDASDFPNE